MVRHSHRNLSSRLGVQAQVGQAIHQAEKTSRAASFAQGARARIAQNQQTFSYQRQVALYLYLISLFNTLLIFQNRGLISSHVTRCFLFKLFVFKLFVFKLFVFKLFVQAFIFQDMSSSTTPNSTTAPPKKKKNLAIHLLSGGIAGWCEALACHPLDTIKVRLQIRGERASLLKNNPSQLAAQALKQAKVLLIKLIISQRATISSSWACKSPKRKAFSPSTKDWALLFRESFPKWPFGFLLLKLIKNGSPILQRGRRVPSASLWVRARFFLTHSLAGLGAGATESVMVVTPMDVIKIRLQAQRHSMTDPLDIPKYRNAGHCAYVMIQEEGFGSLYKGVTLTVLRQGM